MALYVSAPTMETVRLNGGEPLRCEIHREPRGQRIYSLTASLPDPHWTYTDPAGHFHAWSATKPNLPSLGSHNEHRPCNHACGDPECEGYDVQVFTCRLCKAVVEPKWRPDEAVRCGGLWIPEDDEWSLTVRSAKPIGIEAAAGDSYSWTVGNFVEKLSAQFTYEGDEYFGTAMPSAPEMTFSHDEPHPFITEVHVYDVGKRLPC